MDRSASSIKAAEEMNKGRSSNDVTQFTKATSGNHFGAGASAMDVGRYRKLLSSSVQLENRERVEQKMAFMISFIC